MHEQGLGTQMNLKRALSWYEQAARQGSLEAQLKCGCMYCQGRAETRNPKKAREVLGLPMALVPGPEQGLQGLLRLPLRPELAAGQEVGLSRLTARRRGRGLCRGLLRDLLRRLLRVLEQGRLQGLLQIQSSVYMPQPPPGTVAASFLHEIADPVEQRENTRPLERWENHAEITTDSGLAASGAGQA